MLSPTLDAGRPDFKKGMKLLSERKFEAALREFDRVSAMDPKHAEARFQLGRILVAANRAPKAIGPLSAAARLQPEQARYWQAWAEAVALGGNEEAERAFVEALRTAPIDVRLRVELQDRFGALRKNTRPSRAGVAPNVVKQIVGLIDKRDFARAEALAKKTLAAHPKAAMVANLLAVAQENQGKIGDARASFLRAIKIDPRYAEAYFNLGRLILRQERPAEAIDYLRKAVILCPGLVNALVGLGSAFNQTDQHKAALVLLERAVREDPKNFDANLELGNACIKTNRSEEAEERLETARLLAKDDITPQHRVALARMQAKNGSDDAAMANYEKVLSEIPDHVDALSGKASLLQFHGNFDDARKLFEAVLDADPLKGENYRLFFASHKAHPGDPVVEKMLDIYGKGDLPDYDRMQLGFALAKAMEDMGEYDRVFGFLNEANALAWKTNPFHMTKRHREVQTIRAAYEGLDFRAAPQNEDCDFAPIFVTGMPRSGTTLVEQIIASHSTVTSAGELGHASTLFLKSTVRGTSVRPLARVPASEIADIAADYTAYIAEKFPGAERITDKSITTYMHIGFAKLAMPRSRIVVVRRDPRDNLLSMYKNKFSDGTHQYAYDMEVLAHYYGTFVGLVDFWRERVPEWFYEVQYEDLVANPEVEAPKLIEACGLEWEDACLNFHQNRNKVQTLSVYQVRQPISKKSVKGWKRYEKDLEPMLKILREAGHVSD